MSLTNVITRNPIDGDFEKFPLSKDGTPIIAKGKTDRNTNKVNFTMTPFVIIHLLPLIAIWLDVSLIDWVVCASLYFVRMFFVTGIYHRYFSHRSYQLNRFWQFIFAFLAQTSIQKGALWWASHHRHHHNHSDRTTDRHSTYQHGFWYAHIGWILNNNNDNPDYNNIRDLTRFPELVWLNKWHALPPLIVGFVVWLIGGWSMLLIGFFLSSVLLFHGTFLINSLMHTIGKPRYKSNDLSKNSLILALITLGEGWHNNHHHFSSSCRQGFFWWEIDITYYCLRFLSLLGIVKNIRFIPKELKHKNLISES